MDYFYLFFILIFFFKSMINKFLILSLIKVMKNILSFI